MPSRAIVVLTQDASGADFAAYTYLLRADVPTGREPFYANASYVSRFVPLAPDTDPDLAGLQAGEITETVGTVRLSSAMTLAEVKAWLIARQEAFQAAVTDRTTWSRYGTYYDLTKWTAQGV